MANLFIIFLVIAASWAAPQAGHRDHLPLAQKCDPNICKLPDCRCSSIDVPGNLNPTDIPQIVLLTFDDAVNTINMDYYRKAFKTRKNPDGCPIGTTYFVSHEYSDYSMVHELWADGHEIALHSISHQTPSDYWQELSVEEETREFADEADLISRFAAIPKSDIKGIRMPFLQLSGNNSFEVIKKAGLKYDCSWPTLNHAAPYGYWPYTLDYQSTQECTVGPCPTASLPGVWVVPMLDWRDTEGYACAMVDSCINIPNEVDKLVEFMKENFHRHYTGNRAPFGFYVHAAWFGRSPIHFDAYLKFLDYLESLDDVYMVGIERALQWVQQPSTLVNLNTSWPQCQAIVQSTCKAKSCQLFDKNNEARYMTQCLNNCPVTYPWLGNPLGE